MAKCKPLCSKITKIIVAILAIIAIVVVGVAINQNQGKSPGPAPNSGDGIPDGSGFDSFDGQTPSILLNNKIVFSGEK